MPSYLIGGLLDGYRDFVLDVGLNAKAPVIAEIGPWNHAWPEYGVPGPNYEWRVKALQWWDYWLKDIDNGVLEQPRWMVFMRTGHAPAMDLSVVPGYWRCDQQWPFEGRVMQRYFPHMAQQLARAAVADEIAQTLQYRAGVGMAAGGWWGEQTGNMASDDAYSLVYDSEPLTEALEIMGMPTIQLRVMADAPLYQWTVRLEDVAPDGQVSLVSGAIMNPAQRLSRLQPVALMAGHPTTLSTAIHFTTWRFKPGHRIRLAVANAQFPMIWPSPTRGSTQLILSNKTWLDLPIVPVKNETDQTCVLPVPEASDAAPFGKVLKNSGPIFNRYRNEQTGDSVFTVSNDLAWHIDDNQYQSRDAYRWEVNDSQPSHARYQGERRNTFTIKGDEIDLFTQATITSDADHFYVIFSKFLRKNGELVRDKTWEEKIPRYFQ